MEPFSVHVYPRARVTVAGVGGELDSDSAPGLAARLRPLASQGRPLVLELAGLRFCGCAGLSLLLELHRLATATGGRLLLAAPSPAVRRIVQLTRMQAALPVAESVSEALTTLATAPPATTPDDGVDA
ncbi:MAG: STAS domain-containing protein [Sciscionella sp.]